MTYVQVGACGQRERNVKLAWSKRARMSIS